MFGDKQGRTQHVGSPESNPIPHRPQSQPLCEELQSGNVGRKRSDKSRCQPYMYHSVGSGGNGTADDKGTYGKRTETVHRPLQEGGHQDGKTIHLQKIQRKVQRTVPEGNITYPKRSVIKQHIEDNGNEYQYHSENKVRTILTLIINPCNAK